MALIGRQNANKYLKSQHAMPASAIAVFTKAKSRASSTAFEPIWSAMRTTIWLYSRGGVPRPGVPS